jgi:tRNA threonylcarbamoyladenosine biosynthesis protein TsaB
MKASYAIARNGVLVSSRVAGDGDRPSETLFRNLSEVLAEAGLELRNVDLFCAVIGPGSFTGLRVSLAAIEGIAQTLKLPVVGYDTFDAWALAARRTGTMLPIIAAGRGEVYGGRRIVGVNRDLIRVGEDRVGPPDTVVRQLVEESRSPVTIVGDGLEVAADVLREVQGAGVEVTRPVECALAAAIVEHATMREERPLRPYYLRKPDAR